MAGRRQVSAELLLLSTAAVISVYAAGYFVTQPAAAALEQIVPARAFEDFNHGFRDGTYLGSGESRFGRVYVTVQVAGGRITQVWINSVTTTFPQQVIAGLPGAVVARQSPSVNLVTGATASSAAFVLAVRAALLQAQA